jgi:hypothetical protein
MLQGENPKAKASGFQPPSVFWRAREGKAEALEARARAIEKAHVRRAEAAKDGAPGVSVSRSE